MMKEAEERCRVTKIKLSLEEIQEIREKLKEKHHIIMEQY